MEQTVISIIGVLVQELDVANRVRVLLDVIGRTDILGQIAAILVGIHHGQLRGIQLKSAIHTHVDARGHALSTLRCNFDHTVRSFRSIQRSTIVQYFYLLDILDVEQIEQIVIISVVKRCAVILHVPNHTIHNDQRLSDGVQRVDTVDEHGSTLSRKSTTGHDAERAVQRVFHFTLNGNRARIINRCCRIGHQGCSVLIEWYGSNLVAIQLDILTGSCLDRQLHRVVIRTGNIQCCDKFRSTQGVLTVFVGHRCIQTVVQCLHTHTGHRLFGGGIQDGT